MRRFLLLALVACSRGASPEPTPAATPVAPRPVAPPAPVVDPVPKTPLPETPQPAELDCTALPFETTTSIPEASAAAWMTIDGRLVLVVVSDSGNDGAYGLIDPDTGKTLETGALPMGRDNDDVEGLSVRGGKLFGLTSAGWMRVWERRGKAFVLVDGPYPIGPVDLPDGGGGNRPPKTDGMVCAATAFNCGRNYEGLCLPSAGPGFVAAKADGHLYSLVETDGKWQVSRAHPIAVAEPSALADCAFDDQDRLWAGSNLFGLSNVYRIDGWRDPATARVVSIGPMGPGFPEVIAGRGDILYRMSDTNGSPSLMAKFRCVAKQR